MHGLINKAIQCFVRDTYGAATWAAVAREARLGHGGYDAMLTHTPGLTATLLTAAQRVLGHPRDTMLEDLGTYLVSHQNMQALRRLLRFGGVDYTAFLHSLTEVGARARLAVDDLILPSLDLVERGAGVYMLTCSVPVPDVGHVVIGLLRAMADDYGALVLLEHRGMVDGAEVIAIDLLDQGYAAGNRFDLALQAG